MPRIYLETAAAIDEQVGMQVFTDGGLVFSNPSSIGGTWAYVVRHRATASQEWEIVDRKSGTIIPTSGYGNRFENNLTELYAITMAATQLGNNILCMTDSLVSLLRASGLSKKYNGLPSGFVDKLMGELPKLNKWGYVLLSGHPNKKQLASGIGKRGTPCHELNVWCDKECKRLGEELYNEWIHQAG